MPSFLDPRNNNSQVQPIHSTTNKSKLSLISTFLRRITTTKFHSRSRVTPEFTSVFPDDRPAPAKQTTTGNEANIQPSSPGSELPTGKAQAPADPTPPLAASSQTVHTQERTLTSKDIENVWPTCAISLNSVLDSPVITPEGNVYNRNDIVQSLNSNNIDPSTRSPLTQSDLKPFRFLSSLIAAIVVADTQFSDEVVTQLKQNLEEELHAYFQPSEESITVDSNDHPVFNRLKNKFTPIIENLKNPKVFNQFKEAHIGYWVTNEDGKQIFQYDNGSSYTCTSKNALERDQGTMTYANGETYVGLWKNGLRHGQGTMTYATGDTYEGLWENGQPNGHGTMTYANGNTYEGQWVNGHPNGQGTMTYANGETYEGLWKNSRRHGQGTMTYANRETYEGQWENDLRHGDGYATYANGNKYEGQWESGLQHGDGQVTYADDSTYKGEFQNGRRHGQGIRHYNNGNKYEGGFKNNLLHGQGTMTYANGDTYEGLWENGQPNGQGTITYANGETYEGLWENGHPNG